MPEQIVVKTDNQEMWFAIMALVLGNKTEETNKGNGILEVSLVINGVEVSFIDTVRELHKRYEDGINERAAKLAYETATLTGLEELSNTIRQVDYQIRSKIENIFGVKLDNY